MNVKLLQKEISAYIAKGETRKAFQLLSDWKQLLDDDDQIQLTLLSGRFEDFSRRQKKGVLSFEQHQVEQARINDQLLTMISHIGQPKLKKNDRPQRSNYKWFLFPLLLCIIVAFYFFSDEKKFDLSIYFYGDEAQQTILRSGKARIMYGDKIVEKNIDRDGRIILSSISHSSKGDSITIHSEVDGFQQKPLVLEIPVDKTNVNAILIPKTNNTLVKGHVMVGGEPFKNRLVVIDSYKTKTDSIGDFEVLVPLNIGQVATIRVFDGDTKLYERFETISTLPIKLVIDQ